MTLIVFGTGVGSHILINWAHPYVDVSISSLMMLAVPVVAGIAAWVLLGESMTALQILGTLVTIAAMVGVVRGGGARRDGASAAAEAY
jgi:drug/metabolite transporter (DMT)-like permease